MRIHPEEAMSKRCLIQAMLFAIVAAGVVRAQIRRTPEEENTIALFKQARSAVVHLNLTRSQSAEAPGGSSDTVATGFVIDRDGNILTNYHVVEHTNHIDVYLPNGRRAVARLLGTAPLLDLAVLQVDLIEEDGIVPLLFGNSDSLEVGQKVILVGNAMALHNSLTVGVLSAMNRTLAGAAPDLSGSLLQTDAAINPGNSGGPVLDSSGHVIGVALGRSLEGQNLGFAIPINIAKEVVKDLIELGHPYEPSLGLDVIEITPRVAELFGLPARQGILVQDVFEDSPAYAAGLCAGERTVALDDEVYVLGGDVITAINGKRISSFRDLRREFLKSRSQRQFVLTVVRDHQILEVVLTIDPRPSSSK
jgi:S1-C subfamily serine protease